MNRPPDDELHSRPDGAAWRITLSRPARRNALTPDLAHRITEEIERVAAEGVARAILLDGGGGHFCAGLDLHWLSTLGPVPPLSRMRDGLGRFQALPLAIMRAPVPVIAVLRGTVAGFGVDLAAACDLRLAGHSTSFTSAFARMGLVPDGGSTWTLRHLIGDGAALRFLITGEALDAAALERLGLVDEVVDDAELEGRAAALVSAIAANAAGSVAAIKRLSRRDTLPALEAALLAEGEAQLSALQGAEFRERLHAFLARSGGKAR
jgi:2-(1,2-epoxy-1,2-dihydrophenyl)acetyl-CoA isomerase